MGQQSPIYSGATPAHVKHDLEPLVDFQEQGLSLDALDTLLQEKLAPHLVQYEHPGFQSMFNGVPEAGAKHGAMFALAYNQGVSNWQVSPGGAILEDLCCQALCRLFELSPTADATFMYSGTYANQEALYLALHWYAEQQGFDFAQKGIQGFKEPSRLAVAVSRDAHFSIKHAVRMLGLGEDSVIPLALDSDRCIDVAAMRSTLEAVKPNKDIICVIANAGATSTGAVDSVGAIADVCQDIGAWLHVDGAYGFAYRLVPEWKPRFAGIERADSVCWDPHKQLGIPIPNSLLFVRRREDFMRMAVFSSVFNRAQDAALNPGLKSPPSTRPMSALPLVTSLRHQGMATVIERLRAPLLAILSLADYLSAQPDFEVCHQPHTGVLCFRATPAHYPLEQLNDLQEKIYSYILNGGDRLIAITKLDETVVLRVAAVSPIVTSDALIDTIADIRRLVADLCPIR